MKLVEIAYRFAASLPSSERYALVPQVTRAAVSVPANIAEGHGSEHRRVFLNHLSVARGSLMELQTYVELSVRLGFRKTDEVAELVEQTNKVGRILSGLLRAVRSRDDPSNSPPTSLSSGASDQ